MDTIAGLSASKNGTPPVSSPPVPAIVVGPGVFEAMREETQRFARSNQETGGILFGKWIDARTVLVIAATGAGPRADHQQYTFAVDVEYANGELDRLRTKYKGADFLGEWHKHPPTLDRPSGGDLQTVRRQMADPAYPDRMINPITVVRNGAIQINFYYIDRNRSEFTRIEDIREAGSTEFEQMIAAPAIKIPALVARIAAPTAASAPRVPWWLRPNGEARLNDERTSLTENGFAILSDDTVETSRIMTVTPQAKDTGWSAILECYGNYPSNAPRVIELRRKGMPVPKEQVSSPTITGWQPTNSLAEVCRDLRQDTRKQGRGIAFGLLGIGLLLVVVIVAAVLILLSNNSATPIDVNATNTAIALPAGAAQAAASVAADETSTAITGTSTANADSAAATVQSNQTEIAGSYGTVTALAGLLTQSVGSPTVALPTAAPTAAPGQVLHYSIGLDKKSAFDFNSGALAPVSYVDRVADLAQVFLDRPELQSAGLNLSISTGSGTIETFTLNNRTTFFAQSRLQPCTTQICTFRLISDNIVLDEQAMPLLSFDQPGYYYVFTLSKS